MQASFQEYQSPFSWRYGSTQMRQIWSESHKHATWRKIWVALAEVQHQAGLVTAAEIADLKKHQSDIDIADIHQREKLTQHDVVAAIEAYAAQAKVGGGKIHLGATSMDIVDNTDTLRLKSSLDLIETALLKTLKLFSSKIDEYADLPCIAYTHLQPAEPTTLGYRFAGYAQDLMIDLDTLVFVRTHLKAKGMKGAVGTRASYTQILAGTNLSAADLDLHVMSRLDLPIFQISTQVYPRKIDYLILTLLASIASSLAKFAADVRFLSTPAIGEWQESFGKSQVGSSAMPFKKNPIKSEKICSLTRYLVSLPPVALANATHSYLERTLDDSANKRIIMAEACLAADEVLRTADKLISKLVINQPRIHQNLTQYAPFAATEKIIIAAVKNGADRQEIHQLLRSLTLTAWEKVQANQANPLKELILHHDRLSKFITQDQLVQLFEVSNHTGDSGSRAKMFNNTITRKLKSLAKKKAG